jgi:lipid-A-disaccharide synthase-like uncharacterized protein
VRLNARSAPIAALATPAALWEIPAAGAQLPARAGPRGSEVDWGDSWYWLAIGLLGQAAFFMRFLVQWWESERRGESVIPLSFWYLSLVGSVILLAYAIHRREPVFILAYLPNAFVYARNLALIRKKQRAGVEPVRAAPAEPPAIDPVPSARRS